MPCIAPRPPLDLSSLLASPQPPATPDSRTGLSLIHSRQLLLCPPSSPLSPTAPPLHAATRPSVIHPSTSSVSETLRTSPATPALAPESPPSPGDLDPGPGPPAAAGIESATARRLRRRSCQGEAQRVHGTRCRQRPRHGLVRLESLWLNLPSDVVRHGLVLLLIGVYREPRRRARRA